MNWKSTLSKAYLTVNAQNQGMVYDMLPSITNTGKLSKFPIVFMADTQDSSGMRQEPHQYPQAAV